MTKPFVKTVTITFPSKPFSLYVHIPFCEKKCPYCAFYKTLWDESLEKSFLKALGEEISYYPKLSFKTLFLGGGTPSRLRIITLRSLLHQVHQAFNFEKNAEKTIECNPESVTEELLSLLSEYGFTRISLGVQSFQNDELNTLGRKHTPEIIHSAIQTIQSYRTHFDLNLDFIFSIPNSKKEGLKNTLEKAISYQPEHLSFYALSIEPLTPFEKKGIKPLKEDVELEAMMLIENTLKVSGYEQYEISAFSKKNHVCQHNLTYWRYEEFLGLGPSANSLINGFRYTQAMSLMSYIKNPCPPIFKEEILPLSSQVQQVEFVMSNLRLNQGFLLKEFEDRFQVTFEEVFEKAIQKNQGKIFIQEGVVRMSNEGKYLLNEILLDFV